MFGPKFQAWQDKNANLVDGLGALGVGLSQWDAGQPVDMIGAWDSIQNRRAQRKFGEAMRDPALLAGFTPEQKSMLAQMPAQMAQQLIMEKVFAPPPDPVKPNYDYIDGFGMVDMNNPPADMMAGNFKPAPGPAPMSQADRDFWGIPKDDPRAWVIGKDGKPEAIGDLPKPADMPSSVDEYNFYKAQEEAAGRQALSYNEWDLQGKKAGATTVNNSLGAGTDSATKPGQVFDEMKASAEAARAAQTGMQALNEASKALQDGVITGFAADQRLYLAKLGSYLGITDPKAVENTETFRSAIAPQVAAMLKATVGSAQISNSDREFAEKAAGGSIALDEASIKRLIGIMGKASEAIIKRHQDKLNEVYPAGSGADRERALFSVGDAQTGQQGGDLGLSAEDLKYLEGN